MWNLGDQAVYRTPLRTSRLLRQMADETNDARAHDEMHAASVIVMTDVRNHPYVHRWIEGLLEELED